MPLLLLMQFVSHAEKLVFINIDGMWNWMNSSLNVWSNINFGLLLVGPRLMMFMTEKESVRPSTVGVYGIISGILG